MNRNPVGWFEIYVDELDRARAFYETVLAVSLEKMPNPEFNMYAFPMEMDGPGAGGALIQMDGFKAGGNSTIVYFTSADCSIEEGRAVDAGGRIFKSKFSIGEYGFISLVFDTEGNMFGLHSLA